MYLFLIEFLRVALVNKTMQVSTQQHIICILHCALRGYGLLRHGVNPSSGKRQGRLNTPMGALQMYIRGLFKQM